MGQVFGGYELIRHIATGGMAEIYLARLSAGVDRLVVVKRMLPELAIRPEFVTMFLDEARLTASLQHPHVVRVQDLGDADGAYFIAMELVDGPHLGALFAHSLRAKKPLPIELCAFIVARAADGLDYAHNLSDPASGTHLGLVHRDISPQNILVSRTGEVKVTDFGVAKASTQQNKTRTGVVKGKVSYMSPEQCLGENIDRRTDVFALGIVLYELLTRRRLFRDKSDLLVMQKITSADVPPPSSVNPAVDAGLDAITLRALARQAEDRYQRAAEFSEALDRWLASSGRSADELTLGRWFEANCAELAPTSSLTASTEATVALPFSLPESTSQTPSFTSRRDQQVGPQVSQALRIPASTTVPPSPGSEATMISAQPDFAPPQAEEFAPLRGANNPYIHRPKADEFPGENVSDVGASDQAAPIAPVELTGSITAATAKSRAPLIAAAAVAALAVVGAVIALSREPPPAPATVVAAAPALAKLTVESVPPGATIIVGDRVAGSTPVTVDVPLGPLPLQAQFAGQAPQSRQVVIAGDQVVSFQARVPMSVTSTPPNAKVRVNGELLGETPFDRGFLVEPGVAIVVRLEPPNALYAALDTEVTPQAGAPLELALTLPAKGPKPKVPSVGQPAAPAQELGTLSMRTDPWAMVTAGKIDLGETPFAERQIPVGKHTLSIKNPQSGLDEKMVVTIAKEKTTVVILKYEKQGGAWKVVTKTIR